jgi:hypothetical protein
MPPPTHFMARWLANARPRPEIAVSIAAVKRKIRSAADLLALRRAQLWRNAANRAIAPIARVPASNQGEILCEALWDNAHHWLRVAMFRAAAADLFGAGLVGLYEESTDPRTVASLRALPLTSEEMIPSAIGEHHRKLAAAVMKDVASPLGFMGAELPSRYPVHHLYDGILKAEQLGRIDFNSTPVHEHLARALHYLDFYSAMFSRHRVQAVVLSHSITTRFSTLAWTALCRGIPVFIINYFNQHITIRRLQQPQEMTGPTRDLPSLAERNCLTADQRKLLAKWGQDYLRQVRAGKFSEMSMLKAFGNGVPAYPTRDDFVRAANADAAKPNIAVLANCWPDFPNADGRTWYVDYVDWMLTTLAIIRSTCKYNWYVKPHPAEHLYGRRTSLRDIVGDELASGVYYWPNHATGADLMAHVDCVVTAAGTSGIEYPAAGRRILVSRETPYTAWGFANSAHDRDSYAEMLLAAPYLPLPSERQKQDASIYAALALADPHPDWGRLLLPYGLNSYRLWPGTPQFIGENRNAIAAEIALISEWLRSDSNCFNAYAMLREISPAEASRQAAALSDGARSQLVHDVFQTTFG